MWEVLGTYDLPGVTSALLRCTICQFICTVHLEGRWLEDKVLGAGRSPRS
jgi:hypothetical protein